MRCVLGDITDIQDVEAIVNASNGIGVMGAGVAGSIKRVAGDCVQEEARAKCKGSPKPSGSFFATGAGELEKQGIRKIYHAVTMTYPGGLTSLATIREAMEAVIHAAITDRVNSIAFPGLGTGIGGLDRRAVAHLMFGIARRFLNTIEIVFVDRNKEFVNEIDQLIQRDLVTENNHDYVEPTDAGPEQGLAGNSS